MTEEFKEKVEQILEKVRTSKADTTLHIARVPRETKKQFIEWCNAEFEGDYGVGLRWLWDFKEGLLQSPNQQLQEQINVLAEQLSFLQNRMNDLTEQKQQESEIKTLSGKIVR